MSVITPMPPAVFETFEHLPPDQRHKLLQVRELIFQVAQSDAEIGPIEETLRWGEPAYVVTKKRRGSTIRLAVEKGLNQPALFFNCNTTLVEEFRQKFGDSLTYAKNRAIILDGDVQHMAETLQMCIAAALKYHLNRKP